jgi:hypothetical protein
MFLECCAVQCRINWQTFQRCLLPPSSGGWRRIQYAYLKRRSIYNSISVSFQPASSSHIQQYIYQWKPSTAVITTKYKTVRLNIRLLIKHQWTYTARRRENTNETHKETGINIQNSTGAKSNMNGKVGRTKESMCLLMVKSSIIENTIQYRHFFS